MKISFPENFFWGTSTAAAQVETASAHNWRGVKAKDGYVLDRTTDHEKRRMEDVEYIKQLGSVYRCGVDWARLQSKAFAPFDEAVLAEYHAFFQKLNAEQVRIMFVIHHFTNPLWFEKEGGWLNHKNIPSFVDFASQCIAHFASYTFLWNTFNEPNVYAMNAYVLGNFPPFQKNIFKGNRALKNMGRAHDEVYDLLKANDPEKMVGISQNTAWFHGLNFVGKIAASFTDWWFHRFAASFFEKVDCWGISYYAYVPFKPGAITEVDQPGELDRMGIVRDKMWGYRPEGLGRILRRFHQRYGKPMLITENGICSDDPEQRIQCLKDYLQVCKSAMDDGVDLRGYIHWSTWDNFEWHLGPTYRFGLVRINLDTMDREMTSAGRFYQQICQDNAVDI